MHDKSSLDTVLKRHLSIRSKRILRRVRKYFLTGVLVTAPIEILALHGAHMNVRNNNDESPLCLAARHKNINACKALIASGAHYDPELDKKAWHIIQNFNPYALAEFNCTQKAAYTEKKPERRQQERRMLNVELASEIPELSS